MSFGSWEPGIRAMLRVCALAIVALGALAPVIAAERPDRVLARAPKITSLNAVTFSLSGGRGDDQIDGGGGNDRLDGGPGIDRFNAGPGNDFVSARDHHRESVNCGRGRDRVRADRNDKLVGCEKRVR